MEYCRTARHPWPACIFLLVKAKPCQLGASFGSAKVSPVLSCLSFSLDWRNSPGPQCFLSLSKVKRIFLPHHSTGSPQDGSCPLPVCLHLPLPYSRVQIPIQSFKLRPWAFPKIVLSPAVS